MDKQKQKQLITEIMQSDEEQGLYEHPMPENKTKSAEEILEGQSEGRRFSRQIIDGYPVWTDYVTVEDALKAMESYHNQFAISVSEEEIGRMAAKDLYILDPLNSDYPERQEYFACIRGYQSALSTQKGYTREQRLRQGLKKINQYLKWQSCTWTQGQRLF